MPVTPRRFHKLPGLPLPAPKQQRQAIDAAILLGEPARKSGGAKQRLGRAFISVPVVAARRARRRLRQMGWEPPATTIRRPCIWGMNDREPIARTWPTA
jgi:hypothetical protein